MQGFYQRLNKGFYRNTRLPYQLLTPSYVQTGTHLAPDVTANRKPSNDQRTSNAARSIRRMTSAGFHAPMSGSKVHTKAFLSCEQDTILLFTGDQSTAVTRRSCCSIRRMKVNNLTEPGHALIIISYKITSARTCSLIHRRVSYIWISLLLGEIAITKD